jgi:hydrogenase-4 component E
LIGLGAAAMLVGAVLTLWLRSLPSIVGALAFQGVALALVAATLGARQGDAGLLAVAGVVLVAKGALIPGLLRRAVGADPANRETSPLVNVPFSLVAAAGLTTLAYASTGSVVRLVGGPTARYLPVGFATLLIGLFAMTVRRQAVSQIVGLLLVDNGIDLVAFLATAGFPVLIELGTSLDVLLVVIVLRVLTTHLHTSTGTTDLDQLRELHD